MLEPDQGEWMEDIAYEAAKDDPNYGECCSRLCTHYLTICNRKACGTWCTHYIFMCICWLGTERVLSCRLQTPCMQALPGMMHAVHCVFVGCAVCCS